MGFKKNMKSEAPPVQAPKVETVVPGRANMRRSAAYWRNSAEGEAGHQPCLRVR